MPKWLVYLLALAALAGIIFLEQTRVPFAPGEEEAAVAGRPAVTPAPEAPAKTVPAPVVPTPDVLPPQTPSAVVVPPQSPSTTARLAAPSAPQTPSTPLSGAPAGKEQTPSLAVARPAVDTSRWAGLPLDEFLLRASGELVRLSPESVTYLGIGSDLGMRDDHLDPLTREWEDEYYDLEQAIVDHLATYDLGRADPDERLNAEVYRTSLLNELAGRTYSDNVYSVSSYMDSYPSYIEWFLTSLHPLETFDNAVDYVARLFELPARFDELERRLQDSEKLNAVPPRFMLEKAVEQIRATAQTPPRETLYYETLAAALTEMADVQGTDGASLLDWVATSLETQILPAYAKLADAVARLAERATDDAGVWKQTNGAEYYAYCLRSQTTTDLTPDQIYGLGVAEVARIEGEIRTAAGQLGFDSTLSIPELFARVTETTGSSLGDDTLTRCQTIIDGIGPRVAPAFLRMPTQKLVVVDGGYDTYFSAGTLDGSRPGQFFMPTQTPQPIYGLPTVTYHEAVPGHGFQAAYAYEADIPPYVAGISFTAYAEGWALYAERLAWEMGAYDDNAVGNLGRLQDELFRAVRLVLDPGLHAKKWTYEQAVAYMMDHTGFDEDYVRSEVERYIVTPGQAVTYKVGMLKMLELRDKARAALGDRFDLPGFHEAVLGHGELPFDILGRRVDEYIEGRGAATP